MTSTYHDWLRDELNAIAGSLSSYTRARRESPPEAASSIHSVLSQAWDAYEIIFHGDTRYQTSSVLQDVLDATSGAGTCAKLYRTWLQAARGQPLSQYPAAAFVHQELLAAFEANAAAERVGELFDGVMLLEAAEGWVPEEHDGERAWLTKPEAEVLVTVFGDQVREALAEVDIMEVAPYDEDDLDLTVDYLDLKAHYGQAVNRPSFQE